MQKTPISQILTDNLLKFMERQNMNQQRLAEKTGLSVSSVSEIVRGISSPKVSTLEAIASQLRVQAWELLVNDEEIRRRAIEHSLIPPPPTPERAEKRTVHSRKKRRVRAVNPRPDT